MSAVFSFSIDSKIPFQFLRTGNGEKTLHVRESQNGEPDADRLTLAFEWKLRDQTRQITARLYQSEGLYYFWAEDVGWYRIDPATRVIEIPADGDAVRREVRLWGTPTTICFAQLGDLSVHASAVEVNGQAVLFAAPGRFGKTTLAMAFHQNGYRVLSEDSSCCRVSPTPVIFPGPACLRLRPDVYNGDSLPGTRLVAIRPDRVFFALTSDRAGDSTPVPIRAIVFLRESEGAPRLERVDRFHALPDLFGLSFRTKGLPAAARAFETITQLASVTPIWNLYRPLKMDALADVIALIAREFA